jgi:translation initiation factor eIF-2B subunit beta
MPSTISAQAPSLSTFLKSLKQKDIETSIELFISLLQRRQIKNSRPCALATTQLLLRVVAGERTRDAQALIKRIRNVGRRLVAAQPREMAVGNIVRRVLGVIREVVEADQDQSAASDDTSLASSTAPTQQASRNTAQRPGISSTISSFSPLHHGAALPHDMLPRPMSSGDTTPLAQSTIDILEQRPPLGGASPSYAGQGPAQVTSLFGLFSTPQGSTPAGTPPTGTQSPVSKSALRQKDTALDSKLDVKAEVIDGIKELLDELEVVDSQIAESALDHIHSNEIILTHTSSQTVQKFLATAARKRKFTVVHAEAYPNDHLATHATVVNGGRKSDSDDSSASDADERWKPLTAMGITVILIPDSAVFALMSRINKVILAPHTVLANGSLIAASGSATIARAARAHRVPVVVLSGVYKLSPVYPFDTAELIEFGEPGKVVPFQDGEFMDGVDVVNPIFDHVEADLVDLYITNLGAHAPSYLYRIVADHYRVEDVDLQAKEVV